MASSVRLPTKLAKSKSRLRLQCLLLLLQNSWSCLGVLGVPIIGQLNNANLIFEGLFLKPYVWFGNCLGKLCPTTICPCNIRPTFNIMESTDTNLNIILVTFVLPPPAAFSCEAAALYLINSLTHWLTHSLTGSRTHLLTVL